MPNVQHISILDNVVLALQAQRAFGASVGFGAGFEELIPADGFSANEMLFQIRMNGAGCFDSSGVDRDCPGTALVFADGEERD